MNKPRILVVEDDADLASGVVLQLQELGYEPVGVASRSEEAVSLAAALQPDLVLVDIRLGGPMDGIAAAQAIRAGNPLPIVFMTGLADDETISRATLTDPFGFILKPFSERELRAVLELALYKHVAEGRLRDSERRFRAVFEAGPECMKLQSLDGELLEMNAAGLAMLEARSIAEVRTHGLVNFVQPEYRAAFSALHQHVMSGAPGMLEFEATGLRGTRRWLETHAVPMRDASGRISMTLDITRDIGKRKVAESALRLSDLCLKAISQGVIIAGPNYKVVTVNQAFEKMSGYSSADIVGKSCRVLQGPLTDVHTVEAIRVALATATPFSGEVLNYRKDGSTFWNDLSIAPVHDTQGVAMHFIGITRDITERKLSDTALRESARLLQATSQRVLEAQETERRRVAHELHDELGQALTAIKINLQASERFRGQSPKDLNAENIRIIEEALQHVRRLALALRPSMLDDLGLVPALRWVAEQTAQRSGFAVNFHCAMPETRLPPSVETACFRIVQEALTNIARHSHATNVEIDLCHEGHGLVLSVHDDGNGFDVAAMRARAASGGSVGVLGMQERATLIGGQLDIRSQPGQGSTFRLRCPLRRRGEAQ